MEYIDPVYTLVKNVDWGTVKTWTYLFFCFFLGGTSLHAQKRRPLDGFKSDFQMNEIKQDFTLWIRRWKSKYCLLNDPRRYF